MTPMPLKPGVSALALMVAGLLGFSACQAPPTAFESFLSEHGAAVDVAILHGSVVDGLGGAAYEADVLVVDDRIAFIGEADSSRLVAQQYIDARGKVVSPGFIDAHAHGDPLRTPDFENFLRMGVTSIVLGQDGFSPPKVDVAAWLDEWAKAKPGVNLIPFVGHNTLRELSGIQYQAQGRAAQVDSLRQLLEEALAAGCWGLSTGLEYLPGAYAQEAELELLARVVGHYDGMIMSHMRSEDDDAIADALAELLRQGQHCRVHVSHFKVVYGKGTQRAERLLARLHEARSQGIGVSADFYPYTASYTGIGIVFPDWAKAPNDFEQVKQRRGKELLHYLRQRVHQRNGPEATLFGTQPYAGKTLAQLAEAQQRPFEEVLLDIGPQGASGAYFVMDESLQQRLIQDSLVMLCSDGSPGMRHPRGYGSFARMIEQFVYEEGLFPLETAIYKMSGLTASTLGLSDRGSLQVGNMADVLVFDPQAVRERATFEQPHQLAEGFDWVLVNGQITLAPGHPMGARAGQLLLKSSAP